MHGAAILIVEDEALIALDLSFAIEDAGGVVLGSAATSADALDMIAIAQAAGRPIAAAILDNNLGNHNSAPVIHRLHMCGVPMVVYSASGLPEEARGLAAEIPWIPKPGSIPQAMAALIHKIEVSSSIDRTAEDSLSPTAVA